MRRVSEEHGGLFRTHFPEERCPDDLLSGKPIPARKVLQAVLWILNTGVRWRIFPQSCPNHETVHDRFQQWCYNEVIRGALTVLANRLREGGAIDESECQMDALFALAKGGGDENGPKKCGKVVKIMAIVDRSCLPLAITTHVAIHHEVTLVQLTFDFCMVEAKPENLIGDRASCSDMVDVVMRARGTKMISPRRSNRMRKKAQDGRRLRHYERCRIAERFFAWIQWQRRLTVGWEFHPADSLGFVQLGALCVLLKQS